MWSINWATGSTPGGAHGYFWSSGARLIFFPNKRFPPVDSLYCPLTSCKKIRKILRAVSEKNQKNLIFDHIFNIFAKKRFFWKNPFQLFFNPYSPLTSCKESEKSLERIPRKMINGRLNELERTNGTEFIGPLLSGVQYVIVALS